MPRGVFMSEVTDHGQRPEIQPLFISPTPWLHSGRIRGGITQLPGNAAAVSGCWTCGLDLFLRLLSWRWELNVLYS